MKDCVKVKKEGTVFKFIFKSASGVDAYTRRFDLHFNPIQVPITLLKDYCLLYLLLNISKGSYFKWIT